MSDTEPTSPTPTLPNYPAIETFLETAHPEDVTSLFSSIKQGLSDLKGPRKQQAGKVEKALARTEELLHHLLSVREKLIEDRGKTKERKK